MKLIELSVKNYRNLENNKFQFNNEINYIYGNNAQGKTNLLEAIWMLTGTRSFRGSKDSQLIRFNEDYANLMGKSVFEGRNQEIRVNFAQGKRRIFLNGVAKKRLSEIIGRFRTVLFSPAHLSLVQDGPENRRKFLDAAICQLKPPYTQILIEYNQTLKHRNALLKTISKTNKNFHLIDVWNQKLIESGTEIIKNRMNYLSQFIQIFRRMYSEISGNKEIISMSYVSAITKNMWHSFSEKEVKTNFEVLLKNNEFSDIKSGSTSIGPHKDELTIILDGKPLRNFGSQGQQRSAVLAMKLAEADAIENKIQDSPIILLDDVMSELDERRKEYLMSKIKNRQVFITGCDYNLLKSFNEASKFQISNGKLVSTYLN